MHHHTLLPLFLIFFFISLGSGLAMEAAGPETTISAGLGVESLKYQERLPERSLQSKANVTNMVFTVAGITRGEHLFVGFDGTVPVVRSDSRETWWVNDMPEQNDLLRYGRTQLAARVGYRYAPLLNPYLGLRSIWSRQQRSGFRDQNDLPVFLAKINETVVSHSVSLGCRGDMSIGGAWRVTFDAEYSIPYSAKVTNDGLPGWKATDMDGYAWNVCGGLEQAFSKKVSWGLSICAGQQHWRGSDWQIDPAGPIKWPENETSYVLSSVNAVWHF